MLWFPCSNMLETYGSTWNSRHALAWRFLVINVDSFQLIRVVSNIVSARINAMLSIDSFPKLQQTLFNRLIYDNHNLDHTFEPIWFPHWPAWRWTISRILLIQGHCRKSKAINCTKWMPASGKEIILLLNTQIKIKIAQPLATFERRLSCSVMWNEVWPSAR